MVHLWQSVCEDRGAARHLPANAASTAWDKAGRSAWCPCPCIPANMPWTAAHSFQRLGAALVYTWVQIQSNCTGTYLHFAGCYDRAELDPHTWDSTAQQTGCSRRENQEGFTDGSTELHPPSCTVKIRLALFDLLNTNNFNPPVSKITYPSYFYFIRNGEKSLTLVFWTVVY